MVASLQKLSLVKCFESIPSETNRLFENLAFAPDIVAEYNWHNQKKSWLEKKMLIHSPLKGDAIGMTFLSSSQLFCLQQNGKGMIWNLLTSEKSFFHFKQKVRSVISSKYSFGCFSEGGCFILYPKNRPSIASTSMTIDGNFRVGEFVTPSTIVVATNGQMKLYDIRIGSPVWSVDFEKRCYSSLATAGEEKCFATNKKYTVDCVDFRLSQITTFIEDQNDRLSQIRVHQNKVYTSSYLSNNTVKVWDATEGRPLGIMQNNGTLTSSMSIDHENDLLFIGSQDGFSQIWDLGSQYPKVIRSTKPEKGYAITSSAINDRVYAFVNRSGKLTVGCV